MSASVAEQSPPIAARRIPFSLLFKLAVTLAVSLYVLSRAGLLDATDTLRAADWRFVGFAVTFATVSMVLNVGRWRMMLAGQGSNAPLVTLTRLYLIGMFFNNVLPSRFGADLVRAYGASGLASGTTRSVAAVVVDRLVGAVSVLILGLVAVAVNPAVMPAPLGQTLLVMFVGLVVVLGLLLYRSEGTSRLRERLLRLADVSILGIKIRSRLDQAITAIRSYSGAHRLMVRALAISLLANGLSILNLYLYGQAVNAGSSLADVAAVAPLILAVGLLPLSLNGLGTIELAFVVLFGALGVAEPVALAMAILRRLVLLSLSLVGGVLYVARRFG